MKGADIEADRKILSELHVKMLVDETTDVNEEMKYIAEDAILIPPPTALPSRAPMPYGLRPGRW
ncbi:MAG: hypothetical protein ACETVY_03210 [Candidatus Bathyarchaeia archaeon]